jgi:hypothetical protein
LCQIITTFSTGITALNGLTAQVQYFATGTSGSDFNISSSTATHTFNLPTASASNRGALSTADWSTFNGKQNAITLTTTGSSGASTFISNTLNVPTYTLSGLGGVPTSRTLTINGVGYDLSADRSWTVTSMVYPSAGIAVSTGTAWGTSITDNSANWNTAYTNRITSATSPLSITSNVISITDASASTSGVITTGTQTIAGAKTFSSAAVFSSTILANDNITVTKSATMSSHISNVTGTAAAGVGSQFLLQDGGTNVAWFRRNRDGTGVTELTNVDGTFIIKTGITAAINALTIALTGAATFSGKVLIGKTTASGVARNLEVQGQVAATAGSVITEIDSYSVGGTNIGYIGTQSNHNLGIKTNDTTRLTIASTGAATFSSLSGTGNRIVGADTSGLLSSITVGSGLSLSAGVLTATGGSSGTVTVTAGALNSQVPYFTSATNIAGSSNHVWDNTNGRLGINQSSPAYSLDVTGTARITSTIQAYTSITVTNSGAQAAILSAISSYADGYRATLKLNNTHTGGKSWELYSTNTADGGYGAGKLAFVNATDSVIAFIIAASGNILMGTTITDSGYKLDVSGTLRASGIVTLSNSTASSSTTTGALVVTGGIGAGGSIYAASFFESSDKRYKTLIEDNFQAKGIETITPKLYTKNDKVELGYYAQDVQGILDGAVSEAEDGTLSLSYREVHTAKIYALELEIAELKELIKSLIK